MEVIVAFLFAVIIAVSVSLGLSYLTASLITAIWPGHYYEVFWLAFIFFMFCNNKSSSATVEKKS